MTPFSKSRLLWTYGIALFVFLGASAALTPLYPLYHTQWGASLPMLQGAFAIYAVTLLISLLCFGGLSDHIGRRPVALIAIAIEVAAMARFATATGIGAVIFGRALQGLATGIATSVLSAGLQDADRTRGGLVSGMVPMGSMAGFAVLSAALAQFAPQPLHLVFVLLLGALLFLTVAVFAVSETVSPMPGALASLKPRVHVPLPARVTLLRIAPANTAVWAFAGLLLSLGPTIARNASGGSHDPMLGGWVVGITMGAALVSMLFNMQTTAATSLQRGVVLALIGLPITLVGMHAHSVAVFFVGIGMAGAGIGLVVQGAIRSLVPLALVHERAGLMASYFVLSYLAFCVPAFVAGFTVQRLGLTLTADLYIAFLVVLTAMTLGARPKSAALDPSISRS